MTEYEDKYGNTYYVHIHEGGVEDVEDKLIKNAVSAFGSEESEGVVELKKLLKETR